MNNPDHLRPALSLLENPVAYPGLISRKWSKVLLRVWLYPSFKPYCSWAIIHAERELFLRRVVWDQVRPVGVSAGAVPYTYGSETLFERMAYDKLSSDLATIRLAPFHVDGQFGLDGTRYGIEITRSALSTKLSWWETPPASWADLRQWHQQTVELFESILPLSTAGLERG